MPAAVPAGAVPATAASTAAHLRRLVASCAARQQHGSAAWYANKLVTLSQAAAAAAAAAMAAGSDGRGDDTDTDGGDGDSVDAGEQYVADVLLLVEALYCNGEYGRAHRMLEVHGCLDVASVAVPAAVRHAAVAAAVAGAQPPPGPASVVRPAALRAFYWGALALKAMRAPDKAVALLESVMEGGGMPALRTPLRPRDDYPTARERAASMPSSSVSSASGGVAGLSASQSDGVVTWRLLRTMAEHEGQASGVPSSPLSPLGDGGGSASSAGEGSDVPPSPVFGASAGAPPRVSDGSSINLVACMAALRGDCLVAMNNRPRATEWYVAALRCDPYCVSALQALVDHHLLGDAEETQLLRCLTATLEAPVLFTPAPAALVPPRPPTTADEVDGGGARTRARSASASTAGSATDGGGVPAARPTVTAAATPAAAALSPTRHRVPRPHRTTTMSGLTGSGEAAATGSGAGGGLRRTQSMTTASGGGPSSALRAAAASAAPPPPPPPPSATPAVPPTLLDLRWLRELYAMRLNRYSLVASLAARFKELEATHRLGANYDVLAAKAECLQYQHDAAASHAITRKLMAYDALDRRTAALHYANLLALGRSTDLFKLAHAAVHNAPKGTSSCQLRCCCVVRLPTPHTTTHTAHMQTRCRGTRSAATTCRCPSLRWA